MNIGEFNILKLVRKVSIGAFLEDNEGNDVLLPLKHVPEDADIDTELEVFVYLDNEERPVATTLKPKAVREDFAYLQVKETSSYGAFLNWGIEKDLFVPFAEQQERMKPGKYYIVYIYLDEMTQRLTASSKWQYYVEKEDIELEQDQEVDILVAGRSNLGFNVIINNKYAGLLYENEIFQQIETGMRQKGFVRKIRDDKKIDVVLQKQGHGSISIHADAIMMELEKQNGFLPLHDKSDPQEIQDLLGMSKKAFKKAVGTLYKERIIEIKADGIYRV